MASICAAAFVYGVVATLVGLVLGKWPVALYAALTATLGAAGGAFIARRKAREVR